MSSLASPERFLPPISPHRALSPMSPGGRRGRTFGSSEDAHLRDLSPSDTLRAFTEHPNPYDTTRDEYKIFGCIDNLTAAERDLGARVAKAAQRLQSWCQEIEQWGWTGTFEQPSDEYREKRRRSLELRIREHVKDSADSIGPLEYWGSLLSVEVEGHEARLDEIGDELLTLDIEELKEHVLDIHGGHSPRPPSAGFEASRPGYTPMDDFSFLITHTLLSALPHHYQLKDRLGTWTARVSVLREAPRYLNDLKTAQTAMKLGWDAIEPPEDPSDATFDNWRNAVDTISQVLQHKVGDLGQRLDRMLDTVEGREDCLPDDWIDIFESVEADYGRWEQESRRRVMEFDVRRRVAQSKVEAKPAHVPDTVVLHSNDDTPDHRPTEPLEDYFSSPISYPTNEVEVRPRSVTAFKPDVPNARSHSPVNDTQEETTSGSTTPPGFLSDLEEDDVSVFDEGDTVVHNELEESDFPDSSPVGIVEEEDDSALLIERPLTPTFRRRGSMDSISSDISFSSSPISPVDVSPSVRNPKLRQSKPPRPALNATMAKRRPLKIVKDSALNDDTPPWPPTQFSKQHSPNSAEDLDRKISDILTTIPTHIRLTSNTGAEVIPKSARSNSSKPGGKGLLHAARSINGVKSPELTLSPAKLNSDANASSGRRSAAAGKADNDIKLYHLTQPGKEKPIKLFIRRVGENGERVMVRVGGGWADLGEYLRHYAEHHGRRTMSDGKFEILGLEAKTLADSPRPESAMSSKRDRRFSGGRPGSAHNTPSKSVRPGSSKGDARPPTPRVSKTPTATNTPIAALKDEDPSAPSTDSSHHSWGGNEVGLAGPKAKKLDLSGEKLEWIEGMMKQARTVSSGNLTANLKPDTPSTRREGADSRSESRNGNRRPDTDQKVGGRKSFGDLGKVGGTKRLFMRGGGLE